MDEIKMYVDIIFYLTYLILHSGNNCGGPLAPAGGRWVGGGGCQQFGINIFPFDFLFFDKNVEPLRTYMEDKSWRQDNCIFLSTYLVDEGPAVGHVTRVPRRLCRWHLQPEAWKMSENGSNICSKILLLFEKIFWIKIYLCAIFCL
jgi:hypothetical protein